MARVFAELLTIWNSGEVERLPRLLHPTYRGHMLYVEPGERDGPGYLAHILRYRETSPAAQFTVEDQLEEGDRLCARVSARRLDPATGETQSAHGINISRYVDGLLAEEWAVWSAWRPIPPA